MAAEGAQELLIKAVSSQLTGKSVPGIFCSDSVNVIRTMVPISFLGFVLLYLCCIKIQTYQNQVYSTFTFEVAKIRVLLWLRFAPLVVVSFSGPLGGSTLWMSLFVDDRISYTENPKGSHVF